MNLSLRAKLRLTESCSDAELQDACNRYYSIYKDLINSPAEEAIRDIARSKLQDLVESAQKEKIILTDGITDCIFGKLSTTSNTVAVLEEEMCSVKAPLSQEQFTYFMKRAENLPDCAKRHYLKAVVYMAASPTTIDIYAQVVAELQAAISKDPENPIYPEMLTQAEQALIDYRANLDNYIDKERKRIFWERFWNFVKRFFSVLGTILLWVGGAIVTVGGAIISCICSISDCC